MTPTKIDFGGVSVEIDRDKTAELYAGFPTDWCQCDGCTTARMGRKDAMPSEQANLLSQLGLDPLQPYISSWTSRRSREKPHFDRRNDCWFLYGKLIGADRTPEVSFAESHRMWFSADKGDRDRVIRAGSDSEPEDNGLIYIFASNLVPLLYNEVCSFRTAQVEPCPDCGMEYRETGYLKRRSIIPEWKGLPELSKVLREGKMRVFVSFCSRCGRMEHNVVERKRPFRKKGAYERELRRLNKGR